MIDWKVELPQDLQKLADLLTSLPQYLQNICYLGENVPINVNNKSMPPNIIIKISGVVNLLLITNVGSFFVQYKFKTDWTCISGKKVNKPNNQ